MIKSAVDIYLDFPDKYPLNIIRNVRKTLLRSRRPIDI